jgi:hypothetical protein
MWPNVEFGIERALVGPAADVAAAAEDTCCPPD